MNHRRSKQRGKSARSWIYLNTMAQLGGEASCLLCDKQDHDSDKKQIHGRVRLVRKY